MYWKNIDPFDSAGQFCDKGYSYRSVAFYKSDKEKKLIEGDIKDIEKKFNKKVVTYLLHQFLLHQIIHLVIESCMSELKKLQKEH